MQPFFKIGIDSLIFFFQKIANARISRSDRSSKFFMRDSVAEGN